MILLKEATKLVIASVKKKKRNQKSSQIWRHLSQVWNASEVELF